jgi:hypothetical protein
MSDKDSLRSSRVATVKQVKGTLVTLLSATAVSWGEVAGTFDLNFGQVSATPTPRLARRQLWDVIALGAQALTGNANGSVRLFELPTERENGQPPLNASAVIDDK